MNEQPFFSLREKSGRSLIGVWIVALYVVFLSAVLFTLSLYHFQREIETAYIEEFRDIDDDPFVKHYCDLKSVKEKTFDSSLVSIPCIPRSLGASGSSAFQPNRFIRLQNESAGYAIERQQTEGEIRQFIDTWLNRAVQHTDKSAQDASEKVTEEIVAKREELFDENSQKYKIDMAVEKVIGLKEELLAARKDLDTYEKPGLLTAFTHWLAGKPASWDANNDAARLAHSKAENALNDAEGELSLAQAKAQAVALFERNKLIDWFRTNPGGGMPIRVLKGNLENAMVKLEDVNAKLEKTDSVIRNFKETQQKDGDFYNTLFSFFVPVEIIENIWELPTIFMSMVLVLAMGGLGSLITVTIEFLGDPAQRSARFSAYLFRPMLGTIVALAAYIGVKSGQVSVAGEGVSELSPFLLSFLGVLAGIMSERVYRRLVDYGEKII